MTAGEPSIEASQVEAWLTDDPLLTWLERWGPSRGYLPDDDASELDFGRFVGSRAATFERGVTRLLEVRCGVIRDLQTDKKEDIVDILRTGPKIVRRPPLVLAGVRAVPTFLIRSDVFVQLFSTSAAAELRWWRDHDRARTLTELAHLPATALEQPFHYRVVQVRYAGLMLDRRGLVATSGALWLANDMLGKLQGHTPPFAWVLGRSVTEGTRTERSCWERLGPALHHGSWRSGVSYKQAVGQAVRWIRTVDEQGAGWQVEPIPTRQELRPNLKNSVDRWKTAKARIAAAQQELTTLWQVGVELRNRALAGVVADVSVAPEIRSELTVQA